MAKTQIKNYVFKPGIGASDNRFPNAYGLINSNKTFIQKEMSAYIADKVAAASQYTPTAAVYLPVTGLLQLTIGTHNFNVGDAIIIAAGGLTFTNSSSGAVPFLGKALIVLATTANATVIVDAGISTDLSAHSWVSSVTNATQDVFYNYSNTSVIKCERDVGYVIDAYLNDLRYNGNEKTYNTIKYYWDQTVAQVDGDRGAELAAHNFISNLIRTNILPQVSYSASNSEVSQTTTGTATEATTQFTPTDATYIPTTGKMTITIGSHTLAVGDEIHIAPGGITFTCALDGNASLHPYPRRQGVPNTKGKDPYYYAPITIISVTSTTITASVGISSDSSLHTFSSALSNAVTAGPSAKIKTLSFNTVDTIQNGLLSLPKLVNEGVGSIKFQGKYSIDEILLITNSTRSEIIYNFTTIATGGEVTINTNTVVEDPDFAKFLQITDGITTIRLNYNTNAHSNTDDIQLFVEQIENGKSVVTTRPYDFGTDAIERPRAANPLSMLDADFEYGLQPTKWAAIATLRGYPSVYEVPGTDTQVVSVVSDASAGTGGVGQSLITVTTTSAHGFLAGTPITIKALEDSVTGAARAEGSFVIVEIPSATTFTFYAKSKVGTVNPTTLSTSYTQLRQAGFYTGASIGSPTFTVVSNGSNGTLQAELDVAIGSTILPFDGGAPEIGSPLTNASIPTGSQVTGIIDTSAGGGDYLTLTLTANALPGDNTITVADTTGVLEDLAVDNGSGTAIYVTDITGNVISFSGNFTQTLLANDLVYTNIAPNINIPNGSDASFNISTAGGTYTLDGIANSGEQYQIGDRIVILGTLFNGTSPANDLTLIVDTVDSADGVVTVTLSGTAIPGTGSYTALVGTSQGGTGTLGTFDIGFENTVYNSVTLATPNNSTGYTVGDIIVVSGSSIEPNGGTSPAEDLYITVDAVETTAGQALTSTIQTGGTGYSAATAVATTGGTGTGLTFDTTVNASNVITSVVINSPGTGYTQLDIVTISGGGGDATFRIDTVKAVGEITSISAVGTAPNQNNSTTNPAWTTNSAAGANAQFTVAQIGAAYDAISIDVAGTDFIPTNTITILGTQLGGATPANDLTITVDTVDGLGGIATVSFAGTAFNGNTKLAIVGSNRLGTAASFDTALSAGTYTTSINAGGTGYGVGQTLLIQAGAGLPGNTPANNLTVTVTSVDSVAGGVITGITSSGTAFDGTATYNELTGAVQSVTGTAFTVNLSKVGDTYVGIVVSAPGSGYAVGNSFTITGASLNGESPLNDIYIRVASVNGAGAIQTFVTTLSSADPGSIFTLISTIVMTEATTATMTRLDSVAYSALATIDASFTNAHGLVPGASFITTIISDDDSNNHKLTAGSYIATNIPTVNSLRFQARSVGAISVAGGQIQGSVYPRPDSFFVHRPFDGGVMLGTGGPQHGAQAIRQSKKYIRYQSGKGIMYTTGALFAPSYDIRSLTADGIEVNSLITVVTDDNDHGVQEGGVIRLIGVETPGFNSGEQTAVPPKFDYTVEEVIDERTFKVRAVRRLGATTAVLGFGSQMSVIAWHGATVRSGIFDDQNGIYWEFDGTNVSVNQRTGTRQLAGTIALEVDNNLITGTNTRFQDQLKAGDRIIIKGMTHVVSHVNSQTAITVTPDFRGVVNITGAKINLVADKKVKQRDFNLDRLDGTGPSGYDIDIAKMQMIGIQYSWYGAGFIDFMLRGSNGNFVFAHRMRNSNINTEAFMRSGNLPVRYEVTNEGPSGKLSAAMTNSQTTLELFDGSFFPNSGTIYIDNEIMTFTGRTDNTLTGLTRGATFTNFQAGANRTYTASAATTHTDRTGVILISQTITPLISHWGSAFITDGGFDSDRGYIFSYAETGVEVSTTKQTAFMIRLAPSVSNALIGDLGERELLNRAQLLLTGLEVTSEGTDSADALVKGGIVIEGVLNPQNYPLNPSDVGWSGLSTVAQGGQPSFAQVAAGGGVTWSDGASATTANITAQADMSAQLDSGIYNSRGGFYWSDFFYVNATDYRNTFGDNNSSYVVGKSITGTNIPSGTTIDNAYINSSGNYGYFYLSKPLDNSGISANTSNAVTITFPTAVTSKNYGYFTQASFASSGGTIGTNVTGGGGGITVPANTQINNVQLESWAGISYYYVQLNNSFNGALPAGSGTLALEFIAPPFAQPGETIFSFIAVPGERSTLDLNELKELTNTPLGGRGTYPNGPDVLAINVYKVSGAASSANIIIRWGEAQA